MWTSISKMAAEVITLPNFNFQSFDRRTAPATSRPMATLQRGGLLSLNRAALISLDNAEAVELLYDEDAHAVGLRPIDINDMKAYPIRKQPASNSYLVSLTRLCTYYEIDTPVARRYAPELYDDILVIELDIPTSEVARPGRRKSATPPPTSEMS